MGIGVNSPTECLRLYSPPALIDDIFDEILLRLPPEDPALFIRFSLVCKTWRRRLHDSNFLRRYRAFHGKPPMVGFFFNPRGPVSESAQFIPTLSFRPVVPHRRDWYALDSRHGCVPFQIVHSGEGKDKRMGLAVWDALSGDQWKLPLPDLQTVNWNAAVLCTASGCDHVYCHGLLFRIVLVSTGWDDLTSAYVYAPESGIWGGASSVVHPDATVKMKPAVLVRTTLYFSCDRSNRLIEFDMIKRKLTVIETPVTKHISTSLVTMKGGELGLSREPDANDWVRSDIVDLKMLPSRVLSMTPRLIGYAEGIRLIIIWTACGIFAIDLGSGQAKKVHRKKSIEQAIPLMFFCTRKTNLVMN